MSPAEEKFNVTLQHADYVEMSGERIKSRDLYDGSKAVKEKGQTYLFKGKHEETEAYGVRLQRAAADPFVAKIVNARQSLLFASEHTRVFTGDMATWAEDVDLQGNPIDVFIEDVVRDAQVDGLSWVLVDKPSAPVDEDGEPQEFASRKEETEAGARPFFEKLPASAVINWHVAPDKALDWAVIEETVETGDHVGEVGFVRQTKKQWKVWTRIDWTVWQKSEETGAEEDYVVVDEGVNPTSKVPLVPFFGIKEAPFFGAPVAKTVLDHIVLVYNKYSDLDHFETLGAHPVPWTKGERQPEVLIAGSGLHLTTSPEGAEVGIGYLETSGQGFDSIRLSTAEYVFRIFSISLAQAKKDSAQVQNADSQREDRRSFSSSLKTASRHYEAQEEACWELSDLWQEGNGGTFEISYNRDFDDKLIDVEMVKAFSDLVDRSILPLETFLQILLDGEVLPEGFDIKEAMSMIARDIALKATGIDITHRPGDEDNRPVPPPPLEE